MMQTDPISPAFNLKCSKPLTVSSTIVVFVVINNLIYVSYMFYNIILKTWKSLDFSFIKPKYVVKYMRHILSGI
jgi:hypothetical protein